MKKSIFKKVGGLFLGLAMGLGVAVGVTAGNKAGEVNALDGFTALTPAADFTTKSVGCSNYNTTTTYGDWKIVNGANNNKGWTYFKMGGKSATLSSANPCYIYSTLASSDSIDRIDVNIVAGSLSKTQMSVNSWGVYIYSDDEMTTQIDYVAGGTITNAAKLFTFTPSAGKTWAKGSYVKVSWDLENTSTTNGIICVDKVTLYKKEAAALPLSISGDSTVYNGKTITLSASSNGTAVTGVTWSSSNTGVATVNSSTGVVTGVNGTASGANVTITAKKDGYEDATKTITVKADTKTLQSISASGAQSTFTLGDSFATTGLVVTGTYSHTNGDANSEEQITTGITTSPAAGTKLNTVGSQTVTVNAGGKSTTYSINVNYAAVESVELDYEEGTLGKGGEATLPGTSVLPENANQGVSWTEHADNATSGISYSYDPSTLKVTVSADNSVAGTLTFIATATGDSSKTATVVYTVQAAQIANIIGVTASATGEIVAKQYVGDAFNAQGFSFAPTWSEGDHDVVEITADDISWNPLVAGSNPTGTYSCADGEFTVTITGVTVANDTLVSIAFDEECDMTNKSYYVGDSWDFSGLSIVGTMDSGTTAPAISSSNVTFSSDDDVATTTTSITVTATYQGLTATKVISDIVVQKLTMDSLTINYTGGQPVLGTDFTFAGTITANMSNGTHPTVNLSDVTIGSVDKFSLNQQTITVTHKTTEATGTFNVQYKAAQYLGPAPVPANTILFNEPFTGFSKDAKPGASNSSTTVYDGGSVTYTCTESGTKTYDANLAGGTTPELLVAKNGGSFKMAGLPTGSAKVLSFTYACNNTNNEATCDSSAYTMTGSSGSYTLTLKDNTTAPATIDITISNSKASNTRIDNIQLKITTPADRQISDEKHAIRIGDVTCSKSPLIAGETISNSDFKIQVQYDTGTDLTSNIVPTSVSPTTLVAGTHDYTITYTGSYNDTVTKVIQLTAQEPAVLDSISIVKDSGCDDVFTRNDSFTHNGIHVIAHYTDSTTYPDADVTANADITPPDDMDEAGTKTINVSYEENGVPKTTSYQITVNPIVSTYLTLSGEGIEGSNGVYTLKSGVENEVQLSFDKDGDETIEFVQGEQSVVTFENGKLIVNSSTTTSEQITVSFTAGTATATLTVTISAAEGIQNLGDEEINTYVGSSFTHNINIKLNNVESATWTLPQGDFVIESETEDNTGFVGTIYFTDEIDDTITFSALTGKGETLTVGINVFAINDEIKSISASLKSGVTYTAGQGQTFSKDDLTVTYVRDSGAPGTLASNEFTVSGLPEGSFNRVTSYDLTITSVENAEATDSLTINVGMPKDKSGNDLNIVTKTSVHHDGTTSTSWNLLTNKSQLDASEKIYLYESSKGYVTGYNGSDATVSTTASERIEFSIEIVDATNGTFKLKNTTTDKYISSNGSNKFTIAASQDNAAVFYISSDTDGLIYYTNSGNRALAINDSFIRCYTTGNSKYTYFSAYISKKTTSKGYDEDVYTNNALSTTLYNFIAKANEVYANVCGSEGNNSKPDLTTWRSVLESDEYEALVADTDSYNLLKSAVCGEGAYGPDGVYVASGEKQSSDMVIEFLQKYDRVVSNYPSENYNYLGRDVASSGSRINPILALNEVDNSVWVISAVALVGLTAIGGYFFYKKRKEI